MIGAIVIKGWDIHQAKIKWGEEFVDDVMLKCNGKHPSVLYSETENPDVKECLEILFNQALDI
jgi:hypothetical protein